MEPGWRQQYGVIIDLMAGVASALLLALQIYVYCIMVWTFGSWFPAWRYQQWFKALDSVVAPFIAVLQPLKLQYSGIDFTPMAAIVAIEVFRSIVVMAVNGMQG
jgi:YggT family protein